MAALGVGATPSFFINGRFTSGAQPVESFASLIDDELAKANQRIQQGSSQSRYYQEWVLDRGEKKLDP
jgi:predicted DsbA family dithiol-disulfide isomerase